MVCKVLFYCETAFACVLQLLVLAQMLWSWLPAFAQPVAPVPISKTETAPRLGAFLDRIPIGKTTKLVENQMLWRLGAKAFSAYRIVPLKEQPFGARDAIMGFAAECTALGGHMQRKESAYAVFAAFRDAKSLPPLSDIDERPRICVDATEQPMGALFVYPLTTQYGDRHTAVFVMTREAATEMMIIYHRATAKELRTQADVAEKAIADQKRIADWRAKLSIGTETHCGPVLSLRGPMVEVAYNTRAGWVRRERLYPPADAGRCWEFSGL